MIRKRRRYVLKKITVAFFSFAIITHPTLANDYNIRVYEYHPSKYILVDIARTSWPEARVQAIRECGTGRHLFCMRALGDNLLDPDPRIRQESARNLGLLRVQESLPYIQEAMAQEQDTLILSDLIWATGNIGADEGREMLYPYLENEEPLLRRMAVQSLGEIGNSEDSQKLMSMYENEKDSRVRLQLLATLIRFDSSNTQFRHDIIALITDPNKEIRYFAAIEVARLQMRDAYAPLMRARELEPEEEVAAEQAKAIRAVKYGK